MTRFMRTWRLAAVAGLTLGAFACSEGSTDLVDLDGPISAPELAEIDLSNTAGDQVTVNDAFWTFPVPFNVGTGQINPFLSVQANPEEEGFNTDGSLPLDTKRPSFTNALPLNFVPTIEGPDMGLFREIILDANESNSEPDALFSIDRFDLWLCDDPDAATFEARSEFQSNPDCALVYEIDDNIDGNGVDYIKATDAVTSGSGLDLDYQILIPEQNFIDAAAAVGADLSDCAYQGVEVDPCGAFLILDVQMGFQGGDLVTGATFEEFSTIKRPFVVVAKDASPSLTRTHQWDIDKSVDIDMHSLSTGESGTSEYTVDVIYDGVIDSDWAVSGEITIENPSDDDVVIEGVTDEISGVGAVTVSCPVTFPHTLGDGDTLVCTYESDLPDGTNRTNTVTVDVEDLAVGMATADIDFADATITEVDETATIDDDVEGALGNATAPNTPQFTYSRTFTCDEDEGQHDNTATITADDTGTQNSDDESVVVTCLQPDLVIDKSAENETINAGEDARFTITLTNDGPGTAVNATINDPLPAGLDWSLDLFSPDPDASCEITGAVDSEELDCGPLDLADGESITATVSATTSFEACATYPNTAAGDADNHAEVTDDATITCQTPDLVIDKSAENETINAGEDARFTIMLTNNGPGTALGATISDPLPAGLDWSLDSFSPDPAADCEITGAVNSEVLDCGPLDLADGESITATVSATTSAEACATYPNTAAGDAVNHAEVTDDATITCVPPPMDSETAWASNELGVPLTLPFNPGRGGNWATYVEYDGVEKTTTMFADQTTDVGTVTFSAPAGGMVTITIVLSGATFEGGSVVAVQDYDSAPNGNPSPGQFDHKESPDSPTMHTIVVPEADFYAVHAVVLVP